MTLSICIQAGGLSRRMGQNKALLPFAGKLLIQRVVERVDSIASEIIIISSEQAALEFLNLPVIPDCIPRQEALSGLYTSLDAARTLLLPLSPVICPSLTHPYRKPNWTFF